MNNKATTADAIDSASSLRRATMSDLLKPPTSGFKSFVSSRRASNLFKKEKRNIENNDYNNINNNSSSVLSESPLLKQQIKRLIDNNSSNNHNILNTQLSLHLSNDKNKHMIQSLLKINNSPQHKKIIDLISPSKATLPISSLSANKMLTTTDTENYPEFHIIKNRIIDTIINHYNDVDDESALSSISKHQSQSINHMLSTATIKTFSPSKDSTMRLVSSITSSSLSPQRTVATQEKDTTTTSTTDSTASSSNDNNNIIINSSNSKALISTTTSPLSTKPIVTLTDNITTSKIINKNIKSYVDNNNSSNKDNKQEEIKQLQHQILNLQSKLLEKEQIMNQKNDKRWQEIENRRLMACEEVNGVNFINSVLEQRIEELEQYLSRER